MMMNIYHIVYENEVGDKKYIISETLTEPKIGMIEYFSDIKYIIISVEKE
jgi:hypothetical protein